MTRVRSTPGSCMALTSSLQSNVWRVVNPSDDTGDDSYRLSEAEGLGYTKELPGQSSSSPTCLSLLTAFSSLTIHRIKPLSMSPSVEDVGVLTVTTAGAATWPDQPLFRFIDWLILGLGFCSQTQHSFAPIGLSTNSTLPSSSTRQQYP